MRFLLLLVLFANLLLLSSCKKHVPADAAFFIRANPVTVATTSTLQGTTNHKITDLFLYVNGKFQGAYPIGNLMPIVTKNEKVKINLFAGIKNNGISDTRISWVFYDFITLDTLVESGKTIDKAFAFKYHPNTKFAWMENFELPGYTLIKSVTNPTDTTWKIASAADSFEGKSAEIGLAGKPDGSIALIESAISHTLPAANSNVYIEFNYKSTQIFEVGVISGSILKSTVFVNPSESWNKIYIQLADAVNREPSATAHKVYFKMVKTSENANPKVFLDNIKLIYL